MKENMVMNTAEMFRFMSMLHTVHLTICIKRFLEKYKRLKFPQKDVKNNKAKAMEELLSKLYRITRRKISTETEHLNDTISPQN